mmetsp:Transcript_24534/g.71945  ORF Transcript_24534/g.71945 Transcript_24534/m.71945 type:complete len:377 (-) Transcript_24534:169-1299(-)|eukprot:CAMPEP_0118976540 /NCGR_PEP_ID=MMETSP1173-20130426/19131_1 /TAXON_ID=1034831 /ORGANISM="Rhizochromulina marina cf, Strain CCMP1243" /LENGTH=376 /DNA_ID=CAMNT_0006926581 /DNA_START=56 /DNA_END=1186 /DNA_ORIENTATION=-
MPIECTEMMPWFKIFFFVVSLVPPGILIIGGIYLARPAWCRKKPARASEERPSITETLRAMQADVEHGDAPPPAPPLRSARSTRSASVPQRRSSISAANTYHAVSLRWYLWGSHTLGAKKQLLNKQVKLAQLSGLLTLIWAGVMFGESGQLGGYCDDILLHFIAFALTFQIMSLLVSLAYILIINECAGDTQALQLHREIRVFGFFPDILVAFGLFEGLIGLVFWLFLQLGLVTCTITMTIIGTLFSTTLNYYQFLVSAYEVVAKAANTSEATVVYGSDEIKGLLDRYIATVGGIDYMKPDDFFDILCEVDGGGKLPLSTLTKMRAEKCVQAALKEALEAESAYICVPNDVRAFTRLDSGEISVSTPVSSARGSAI